MPFRLASPLNVGDISRQISVNQVEIASISINLQKAHIGQGNAVLSVVLEDPDSDWQTTITFRDSSVLEFWGGLDKNTLSTLLQAIWDKLVADGKIPAGSLALAIPQERVATAAVAAAQSQKLQPAPPVLSGPATEIP